MAQVWHVAQSRTASHGSERVRMAQPGGRGTGWASGSRLAVVPKHVGSSGPPWRLSAVYGSACTAFQSGTLPFT